MTIAEQLQDEMEGFLDDDFFGEDIIYGSGGVEYSIRAFVYRGGMIVNNMRFDRGTESKPINYEFGIRISSNATTGRSAIILRSDYAMISKVVGADPIKMYVAEIVGYDSGSWKLGLRA